jgi:6-pyruvoyltetrahydropterin/6-carboxytetrahydropterin synthase
MLELTTYTELEIAHRLLTSYAQRCRHLHGHRYEVEITVASKHGSLNKDGMIVDFKKLKEIVKRVLDDVWDHGACFNAADPLAPALMSDYETARLHIVEANPTLEWMVETWAKDLQTAFDTQHLGISLTRLTASETAKNTVTWTPQVSPTEQIEPPKRLDINISADVGAPVTADVRARYEMAQALSAETGADATTCRTVLADCNWDVAHARKKIEYLRRRGVLGCRLADAGECQLKEKPKMVINHIEVPIECKPEDKLFPDEIAYLVSYWPVGYPQPISGVFATAMRGVALVRTLQAAIDEKHPAGAALISVSRVPS